jgi:hypothetical protein
VLFFLQSVARLYFSIVKSRIVSKLLVIYYKWRLSNRQDGSLPSRGGHIYQKARQHVGTLRGLFEKVHNRIDRGVWERWHHLYTFIGDPSSRPPLIGRGWLIISSWADKNSSFLVVIVCKCSL